MLFLFSVLAIVYSVSCLTITNPTAGRYIDSSKQFNITWITEVSDPKSISINIVDSESTGNDIVYTVVQGYDTFTGQYEITLPEFISMSKTSCRLVIADSKDDNVIVRSDTFNLMTQPPVRRQGTIQGTPPDPSDDIAKNYDPSAGETRETLIAETVIPGVVVVAVVCFGINVWSQKLRRRRKARNWKGKEKAGERGRTEENTPADIEEARLVNGQDSTHDFNFDFENVRPKRNSFNIMKARSSRKSHIKWNLPVTPRLSPYSSYTDLGTGRPMIRLFPDSFSGSDTSVDKPHRKHRSTPAHFPHRSHRPHRSHLPSQTTSSSNLLQPPIPAHFSHYSSTGASSHTLALPTDTVNFHTPQAQKSSATLIQNMTPRIRTNSTSEPQHRSQTAVESPVSPISPQNSRDITSPIARSRLSAILHDLIHEELSRVGDR